MNILDKLRKQSTANKFKVTLTKKDAEELLLYQQTDQLDPEAMREIQAGYIAEFNDPDPGGALLAVLTCTWELPFQIDYHHQVFLNYDPMLRAFIISKLPAIEVYIEFITSKPNTESD